MVFSLDAPRTRMRVIDWTRTELEQREIASVAELARYKRAETVTWIEVEGLGDETVLRELFALFEIHPLAQADVVNVGQRPKTESYEAHDLVICRMALPGAELECELEQVSLLIGPNWVISVQEGVEDVFDPIRERIRAAALIRTMRADFLAYALIDTLIDGYYPVVERLTDALDALEEEAVTRSTKATLTRIHVARRELLRLHRIMRQQRDALNSLLRGESPRMGEDVRVYLRDAFDHAIQIAEVLEGMREMAIGLTDVYLSSVSNRLNEVMKVLTVMSTIFIPLTFVVGVYGMNFDYQPELHVWWGYPAVWAVMLALAGGLLAYFIRLGWIGRGQG